MATLFFSYSHKDENLRDELETHLAMLKREGTIDAWHDRRISAGDVFDKAINDNMEKADVILLLVSPDFLASSYCYDIEVHRAMERHEGGLSRVIPVILRPCDWKGAPFAKLLAAPRDSKPVTKWADLDEAFLDVVHQIRAAFSKVAKVIQASSVAAPITPVSSAPRSSNLRLKKDFTEADRDRFMDEAFDFMARFFEASLNELAQRNDGIESRFKRVDATQFSATIYRGGAIVSRCAIRHRGDRSFGKGITFSSNDSDTTNSFNECLNVQMSEQSLFLKSMGIHFPGNAP